MKIQPKNSNSYAVVVFDGISPFHLSVPCIIFKSDSKNNKAPDFKVKLCAVGSSSVQTNAGYSINVSRGLSGLKDAGTIIVPSWNDTAELPPKQLLDALRKAHQRGIRIVSFCLGLR